MTTGNLVDADLLEAVYENHRADVARREADYTRELNAKLGQINAQAKTIQELVNVLKEVDLYGEALIAREYDPQSSTVTKLVADCRKELAEFKSYTLPTGRTK